MDITLTTELLDELFNEFNLNFFKGSLPKIPIVISKKVQRAAGMYEFSINRYTKQIKPVKIIIASNINWTLKALTSTLVHEMIHLYESIVNDRYLTCEKHGMFFQSESKRIEQIDNFVSVSTFFKYKSLLVGSINLIYIEFSDGDCGFIPCSDGYKYKIIDEVLSKTTPNKLWTVSVPKSEIGAMKELRTSKRFIVDDGTKRDAYYQNEKYNFISIM